MKGIIDFHTHAFPDNLAEKAIKTLEEEGGIKAHLNGKISSLISSMDTCSIEKSIVCSIATKPSQFDSILKWSREIKSDRIIPFPSFHPQDSEFAERISQIKNEGFKGIKFHPYYQNFTIDEEYLFPIYEKICREGLLLVMHTGFDFAFPFIRKADPQRIVKIKEEFPELKLVTTHLGSWQDWENVEKFIVGKRIYMEISFSLEFLKENIVKRIIVNHPEGYVLFGTDSPWTDQKQSLDLLRKLQLGEEKEKRILRDNAVKLLR